MHNFLSAGSFKGSSHIGKHCPKIYSHISSHHGGSHMSHNGGSHMSHHGGHHMSHHGGSQKSHHGGSYMSHHGGHHMSHHGGHYISHHGGHNMSHHAAHHKSYQGAHLKSHHGGSHISHHGGHHMSHHGGHYILHHGGSHKSHHGGSQMSHHGGQHMSHHGEHHMSHNGGPHVSHHGSSKISHHGGHYQAPSLHGSSTCKSVSFTKHSHSSHGCDAGSAHGGYSHGSSFGGHSGWKSNGLLSTNEKETMQILNDRLSSYLEKVRSLEQENAQLERKISEWYENNAPSSLPDSSQYFRIIRELQNQISAATVENARIVLQIDNARLAADDFRVKYEMERNLNNSVQADISSLRGNLESMNRENCDLENQVQNLQEELQQMKRNHEEEVNCLRAQLGARVNVELNAAPSVDLNAALNEIREQYENLMERNMNEAEAMFRARSEELNRQVTCGSEQLESITSELIELKRCAQTLEIELQSQLSMTSALENTLAETEASYGSQLTQLQGLIDNVEAQLAQIRCDLERQNQEYRMLMDQKTHLEMEIATYKRLLDGHNIQVSEHMSCGNQGLHQSTAHHTEEDHADHGSC